MPDDLIAFAWSAPMRDLAAKLELSDVGLEKLLTRYRIAVPPQGYWNKVRAGERGQHYPRRHSGAPVNWAEQVSTLAFRRCCRLQPLFHPSGHLRLRWFQKTSTNSLHRNCGRLAKSPSHRRWTGLTKGSFKCSSRSSVVAAKMQNASGPLTNQIRQSTKQAASANLQCAVFGAQQARP